MILTAAKFGYSGITLTDHEALCGHIEWLELEKELKKNKEIPEDFTCALGNEIYLVDERKLKQNYWHFILIAKNSDGHRALRELSSQAWIHSYRDRGMERVPTLKSELADIVKKYPGSLVATNACFVEGTKVLTSRGYKNIEEITSEDFILNRYGEWEKVNFPTSRDYEGTGYEVSFFEGVHPIKCTENHKFLVTTGNWSRTSNPARWVEAKDLENGKDSQKYICLFPIVPEYEEKKKIISRKEWEGTLREISYPPKYLLPDEILITPELMQFFGLWLGDGYISLVGKTKRVGFTFSQEEFSIYWDSFFAEATEQLGIAWRKDIDTVHHKIELSSSSIELVELFYYLFGLSHAKEKYIPERLYHISDKLDWALFMGYAFADGYFRTRKKGNYSCGEFCSTSISRTLTLQMKDLLQSLGIRSSITVSREKTDKKGVHHCEAYYLSSSNNAWVNFSKKQEHSFEEIYSILLAAQKHDLKKHIFINGVKYKKVYIKSIKKITLNERVYCLNVDSHSFCCEGVIVHNCIGGQVGGLVLQLIEAEKRNDIELIYQLKEEIDSFMSFCIELFGDDFYIEIAPGQSKDQKAFNKRIKPIAAFYNRKMITATDAHFLTSEYRPIHKAFLNSKDGEREVDSFYYDAHLMDNEEAFSNLQEFYTQEEFDKMCENSEEIRQKIQGYNLFHSPIIPEVTVIPPPPIIDDSLIDYPNLYRLKNSDNPQERQWVNDCLDSLIEKGLNQKSHYAELELEADIISCISEKLNNCLYSYFNTFKHYIDLFWECGSIVGPGRGSSGAFLSNYLLGITQLDPLVWGFPYFRFLNKERAELPDIDIDLTPSKRPLILKKIREERGELNVLQVATFGTSTAKESIAVGCRGYRSEDCPKGIDVDVAQYMSGLVPQERGISWTIKECLYGNEAKERKPVQELKRCFDEYPGLEEIVLGVENVIVRRGQHASGVILYNKTPFDTTAIMKSPNGDLTTQFNLLDAEEAGDVKFDFLVTEICDKISTAIDLLQNDGYFEKDFTKRQIYDKYLHPQVLDLKDQRIWDALAAGTVQDVFQFNSAVGLETVKAIKPQNPIEMCAANGLMRLVAPEGQERPFDRYIKFKKDISLWYQEMDEAGLTKEEQKILEPYYLQDYGVPTGQEALMKMTMDPKISNFTLAESNNTRKILAKFLGTLYY